MTPNRDVLLRHLWSARFQEGTNYVTDDAGCCHWTASRNAAGYGICGDIDGERLAHRISFATVHGPIPDERHIHHKCEVKDCINPDHLEMLTPTEHRSLHGQADSTLTWDDVRAIRAANKAGVGIYAQAEIYGLRISTLQKLIAGETWLDADYVPGVERACGECGAAFVTTKVSKRFCRKKCRDLFNGRRTGRRARGQNPDGSETRGYPKRKAA